MTSDRLVSSDIVVHIPRDYPSSTFFIDESGARSSGGGFFVVAGIKVRRTGLLSRALLDVREKCDFRSEFKFSQITRGALVPYYEAISALFDSDAHIVATVVDRGSYDPVKRSTQPDWVQHADIVAQLLAGSMNRREVASALVDGITTPVGTAFDDTVRRRLRARLGSGNCVAVTALDSRSTDLLQMADLVAGAIAFDRRKRREGGAVSDTSNKGKVAARLRTAFGLGSFDDQRGDRVNIATLRPPTKRLRT